MSIKVAKRNTDQVPTWAKDGLPPFTGEDALYPESDGLPMSDSTLQYEWITRIQGGLEAQFRHDPNVFVAGDLFWYPVEGQPAIRVAPDVLVVLGRPQGQRRSYRQWREGGVAPQVVFEIWSYSNRPTDKQTKLEFYDRYGVEEYYAYDPRPRKLVLEGWLRRGGHLVQIAVLNGWVSPLLGVRFQRTGKEWNLYHPNGEPFVNYKGVYAQREAAWAKLHELGIDPETL